MGASSGRADRINITQHSTDKLPVEQLNGSEVQAALAVREMSKRAPTLNIFSSYLANVSRPGGQFHPDIP